MNPLQHQHGTVLTMLAAMSVLSLLGLRHPQKMLPILLLEVGWKLTRWGFGQAGNQDLGSFRPGAGANDRERSLEVES